VAGAALGHGTFMLGIFALEFWLQQLCLFLVAGAVFGEL